MKTLNVVFASLLILSAFACFPPVYIYERPTVMEEEASGEYPLLKEKMLSKTEAMGPAMLDPDEVEKSEKNGKGSNLKKEKPL